MKLDELKFVKHSLKEMLFQTAINVSDYIRKNFLEEGSHRLLFGYLGYHEACGIVKHYSNNGDFWFFLPDRSGTINASDGCLYFKVVFSDENADYPYGSAKIDFTKRTCLKRLIEFLARKDHSFETDPVYQEATDSKVMATYLGVRTVQMIETFEALYMIDNYIKAKETLHNMKTEKTDIDEKE